MAEKLDAKQVVTFEELLTNEEVLEEGIQCRSPCWKDKGIGCIKSPTLSHHPGGADL